MLKTILILLAILIIGTTLYVVISQVVTKVDWKHISSFFTISSPLRYTQFDQNPATRATTLQNNTSSQNTHKEPLPEPPYGFTLSDLSPFYNKITISSFSQSYDQYYPSIVSLRVQGAVKEGINISGWTIKGKRGGMLTLPKGVKDFSVGGYNKEENITIKEGEYITASSARSPVNTNFLLNECTGYLNAMYTFVPSLGGSCPSFDTRVISNFGGACQSFAQSMGGCRVPTSEELNRFTLPEDVACHTFLTNINYAGCYRTHRNDSNFFGKEWRVWLNTPFNFNRDHDRIFLYDNNGLIVDEYAY